MIDGIDPRTLQRAMHVRGIGIDELAEKAGCHPDTIRRALAGDRLYDSTRQNILGALATTPKDPAREQVLRELAG